MADSVSSSFRRDFELVDVRSISLMIPSDLGCLGDTFFGFCGSFGFLASNRILSPFLNSVFVALVRAIVRFHANSWVTSVLSWIHSRSLNLSLFARWLRFHDKFERDVCSVGLGVVDELEDGWCVVPSHWVGKAIDGGTCFYFLVDVFSSSVGLRMKGDDRAKSIFR